MKTKRNFTLAALCGLLAVLLIVLVRTFDVLPIGPAGTSVGMAHLNRSVFETVGTHDFWYTVTECIGYFSLALAGVLAVLCFVQLLKRKSLLKVDRELVALCALYAILLALYVFFEIVIINYRPVILPGDAAPEASFPSSHTMLSCVILGSAMMLAALYVKKKTLRLALQIACAVLIAVTVIGRLVSGVHWFTDILGGVLFSAALLFLFAGVISLKKKDTDACTFRPETPDDYRAVEELIRDSFWNVYRPGCYEHYVIHVLRDAPAFVKELDFVMEKDGKLIGQNMFVKTVINGDDGKDVPVLTMGPICITPELKRQGYGKKLLDYSLEKAAALGYGAVLFEGNIGFYGKSGFDYARNFGIRYHDLPEGEDDSFFLCRELIPGYLDGVTGVYQTPQGYYVKKEDVEEFDKAFPPKEKLKLPTQLFEE